MTKPRFLPKFPIFVQDWLSSMRVRAMTLEERGAFLELLLLQWQEGGLPGSGDALLRLAGLRGSPTDHPLILEAFPIDQDGQRRNQKCAQVRAEAEAYCGEQARKSALGVTARTARWSPTGQPADEPTGNPVDNPRVNPRVTPPTPTPTPTLSSDSDSDSSSASLRSAGADKPRRPSKPRKEATGPHPEAIRAWDALWFATRGVPYVWQAKDAAAVAKCLKFPGADLAAFSARAERLLRDPPDEWHAQNASPALLASRWNQILTKTPGRAKAKQLADVRDGIESVQELEEAGFFDKFDENGRLRA